MSYWDEHRRFKRLHQHLSLWSICISSPKIEVTWFSGDDIHERTRVYKIDHEVRFPHVLFRPYCLRYGHSDDSYGECVICKKRLHG